MSKISASGASKVTTGDGSPIVEKSDFRAGTVSFHKRSFVIGIVSGVIVTVVGRLILNALGLHG